jgi:uncharacterized protein (DUF433 family)
MTRNEQMVEMRARGMTLAEIGDVFGVTRERVRQLTASVPAASVRRLRASERALILAEERPRILALWTQGLSIREIAEEVGIVADAIQEIINTAGPRARTDRIAAVRTGWQSCEYTNEKIGEVLRAAALDIGGTPSFKSYIKWREGQTRKLPAAPTITNRFGSWTAACAAAGLTPNRGPGRGHAVRYDREDAVRAVRRCWYDIGRFPGCEAYEAWHSETHDGPSAATIRKIMGGWVEVRRALMREQEAAAA